MFKRVGTFVYGVLLLSGVFRNLPLRDRTQLEEERNELPKHKGQS